MVPNSTTLDDLGESLCTMFKNSKHIHMRLQCYHLSVVSHSDLLLCSGCKFVSEIRWIERFPCDRTNFLFNFAITRGKQCWPLRQLFGTLVGLHHVKLDRIVTYSSHSVGRRRVCRRSFLTFLARHHYNAYCGALYAIARPSVTRVDQSKTVEVRIMKFSPTVGLAHPPSFCGVSFILNF